MRVLLISGNREDADIRVPALGLACVAAACGAAGQDARVLDLLLERDPGAATGAAIREFRPDAIGVSVRNIDDQEMHGTRFLLDQARDAVAWCRRESAAPVILGGAGFSILPGPILDYVGGDMGIQGEGEAVFPELLRRLEAGRSLDNLPGLFRKGHPAPGRRAFAKDLDAFPLPDPALLARSLSGAEDAPVPVQTRRGCPMTCSYCSTPLIEGKTVRWRSPEFVALWMRRWTKLGFRNFYFVDNTFNLPPFYARRMCAAILEAGIDIRWRCILFPGGLDPELIGSMARAGCGEVSLGFESGSEHILRRMHKLFVPGEVRHACEMARSHGIRTMGFLLLGGPGETKDTVLSSLDFAESLGLDDLRITVGVRIYPGTDVARAAMEEGLIDDDTDLLRPRFYMVPGLEDWIRAELDRRRLRPPHPARPHG